MNKPEYYIYTFLLYKSNAQNQFTFSKALYLQYKGFINHYVLLPYPNERSNCYKSYFKFKEAIISLLDKYFLLKYDENGAKMLINPIFAYAPYRGTPGLCQKFANEYVELIKTGSFTQDIKKEMCLYYIKEAKKRIDIYKPKKKAA